MTRTGILLVVLTTSERIQLSILPQRGERVFVLFLFKCADELASYKNLSTRTKWKRVGFLLPTEVDVGENSFAFLQVITQGACNISRFHRTSLRKNVHLRISNEFLCNLTKVSREKFSGCSQIARVWAVIVDQKLKTFPLFLGWFRKSKAFKVLDSTNFFFTLYSHFMNVYSIKLCLLRIYV